MGLDKPGRLRVDQPTRSTTSLPHAVAAAERRACFGVSFLMSHRTLRVQKRCR